MFNGMNQLDSEVFIKNIYTDFSFIQQLVIEYLSCAYRCIIYAYMHIYETESMLAHIACWIRTRELIFKSLYHTSNFCYIEI